MTNRLIDLRGNFEPFIGAFFIITIAGDDIRMFGSNNPGTPDIHANQFSQHRNPSDRYAKTT
jgi:hypothetical protein